MIQTINMYVIYAEEDFLSRVNIQCTEQATLRLNRMHVVFAENRLSPLLANLMHT